MFQADELLLALREAHVRFVVIGGIAVGVHGYVRATKDLDIVPDPEPENPTRLSSLLGELEAQDVGIGDFAAEEFPYDPTISEGVRTMPQPAGRTVTLREVLDEDRALLDVAHAIADEDDPPGKLGLLYDLNRVRELIRGAEPFHPTATAPPLRGFCSSRAASRHPVTSVPTLATGDERGHDDTRERPGRAAQYLITTTSEGDHDA